jgi:hypothetical protein
MTIGGICKEINRLCLPLLYNTTYGIMKGFVYPRGVVREEGTGAYVCIYVYTTPFLSLPKKIIPPPFSSLPKKIFLSTPTKKYNIELFKNQVV